MKPRIAIVGAGAVGGYVGGQMAMNGHDVTLIDPWPEHIEAIRREGLRIEGTTAAEQAAVRLPAMHVADVQSLSKGPGIDIALISVKSYDTEWASMLIRPYLSAIGYVASLQNCINEERIADIVGWGRVVGAIPATLSVDLHTAGQIRRTTPKGDPSSPAVFRIGEVHGRTTERMKVLAAMIAELDTVTISANLWGERWTKLCVNVMVNGISAVTGLGGNDCFRNPAIRRFMIRVSGEAVRVGQALGYQLEPVSKIPPDRLALAGEGDPAALEEVEAVLIAGSTVGSRSDVQRPSMGQDILKGRRTEIDYINGFVARKGAKIGHPAPANAALTDAVKRVERGELPAQPENIAALSQA